MPDENKQHSCCFFGHRKIEQTPELVNELVKTIENLITENDIDTFLFGSKSEFNSLCIKVVTDLKEKYPHIKRIYVRSAFPDIDDSYKAYLLESYEETYYPEKLRNSGKASYVERNQEMINKSDFCVVYYDENYAPPRRNSKREIIGYQPRSGTKIAYSYALKKKCRIINILQGVNENV